MRYGMQHELQVIFLKTLNKMPIGTSMSKILLYQDVGKSLTVDFAVHNTGIVPMDFLLFNYLDSSSYHIYVDLSLLCNGRSSLYLYLFLSNSL